MLYVSFEISQSLTKQPCFHFDWQNHLKNTMTVPKMLLIFQCLCEGCTHRLVVVTVSCRPHKWWFVFERSSLKDWLGWDSKQEVWSPARGSIRLEHTEEATVSVTFIMAFELLTALLKACIGCCPQTPYFFSTETPANPSFSLFSASQSYKPAIVPCSHMLMWD